MPTIHPITLPLSVAVAVDLLLHVKQWNRDRRGGGRRRVRDGVREVLPTRRGVRLFYRRPGDGAWRVAVSIPRRTPVERVADHGNIEVNNTQVQIHVRDGKVRLYIINGADWSKRYQLETLSTHCRVPAALAQR